MTDNFNASQTAPAYQQRDLMTEAELDALVARGREALESVTKGPWSLFSGNNGRILSVCIGDKPNGRRPCIVDTGGFEGAELPKRANAANGNFIAAARDLVPELLDAIAALRAERDELRAAIFGSGDYCKTLRNGNFVEMAQATEAGRKGAIARAEAAEARALAAEAAALERAAMVLQDEIEIARTAFPQAVPILAADMRAIRALITPAARTALDAALADARREGKLEGIREAAQMADDWSYDPQSDEVTDRRLGDAIRALAARVEGGAE